MIRTGRARARPASRAGAILPWLVLSAAVLLPAPGVEAQQDPPRPPAPRTCDAAEYRQFDFWVGEWDVWTEQLREQGRPPARSRISAVEDGCVIQEEFTGSTDYSGRSLNYYDRRDGQWHQVWIDSQGNVLVQTGGMQGDSMVLEAPGPEGAQDKLTWTPLENGKVRQHWTRSTDGGKTWSTVFDGMYHPRKK